MMEATMNDVPLLPAEIAGSSVAQLAAMSPRQKAQFAHQLEQAAEWLQQVRAKFDASIEHAYGDRLRSARSEAGNDTSIVHIHDGDVRVSVEQSTRVCWDQAHLGTIARRIAAAGERVEDFIDVAYSISESRFHHWPPSLRAQFEVARTVELGAPSYRLAAAEEA
jgi:hypothetical protein